nr:MAG TPA: hypothetical protein [Caudoviricetes sp.]
MTACSRFRAVQAYFFTLFCKFGFHVLQNWAFSRGWMPIFPGFILRNGTESGANYAKRNFCSIREVSRCK